TKIAAIVEVIGKPLRSIIRKRHARIPTGSPIHMIVPVVCIWAHKNTVVAVPKPRNFPVAVLPGRVFGTAHRPLEGAAISGEVVRRKDVKIGGTIISAAAE